MIGYSQRRKPRIDRGGVVTGSVSQNNIYLVYDEQLVPLRRRKKP